MPEHLILEPLTWIPRNVAKLHQHPIAAIAVAYIRNISLYEPTAKARSLSLPIKMLSSKQLIKIDENTAHFDNEV